MGPSRGDTICADVVIEAIGPMSFGALALGPIHIARTPDEPKVWLATIERTLLPKSADVSRFMAGVGELARATIVGAVPLVLVDREADFCVVGYRAIEGAQTVTQIAEHGADEGEATILAFALARTLAELHTLGYLHGLLGAGTVVRAAGTWWTWEHGIAGMCVPERLAPRLRPLGGDPVAPELRAGAAVSPASDVFAWGAVVACLLTGAIGSEAINLLLEDEREDPLRTLVRACLDAVPELRPKNGAVLLQRLQIAVPQVGDESEAAFAELNLALGVDEDDSRFGLPGDPRPPAASKPPPPPPRASKPPPPPLTPRRRDVSIVEELVIGPDEGFESGEVERPELEPAAPQELSASDSWREIAEHYLSEHPPTREEVDELPLQELVLPPPGARNTGAVGVGRVLLKRVRTGPQKIVRAEAGQCSGTFDMSDVPEPDPELPRVADDAPEMPLRKDDDDPWNDPEAAIFDLDADGGPRRVDEEGDVDLSWPDDSGSGDTRSPTWPPGRLAKLGVDEDTPAHPAPLAVLEAQAEAAARTKSAAPAIPPVRRPAVVMATSAADVAAPLSANVVTTRGAKVDPDSGEVPRIEVAAKPKPAPAAPMPARAVRARSGRGMALGFAVIAGAIVLAATLAVAREHGGLAQLLDRASAPLRDASAPTTEAPLRDPIADDAHPRPADAPTPARTDPAARVEAPPKTCPAEMRAIDANVCIDRAEFPGLAEIPKTQIGLDDARAACEERGARLCSAQEWRRACKGPHAWRHPYGANAELDRCNAASPSGALQDLSRTGARTRCVTASGVFDLEGNVSEWVSEGAVLGGDAGTRGASCETRTVPPAGTRSAVIGFRCCASAR